MEQDAESSWLSDSDSETAAYEEQCAERIPVQEVFDLSEGATRLFIDPMDEWEKRANAHFALPALPVDAVEYFRRSLGVAEREPGAETVESRFKALSANERMPFLLLDQRDLERYRRELDAREEFFFTGTPLVKRYNDGEKIWWRCGECLVFNGHIA